MTEKQVRRKMLKQQLCITTNSRQGRVLGFLFNKRIQPITRNLWLFLMNNSHWVNHNQVSPFLAEASKGHEVWAETSSPKESHSDPNEQSGKLRHRHPPKATTGKTDFRLTPMEALHYFYRLHKICKNKFFWPQKCFKTRNFCSNDFKIAQNSYQIIF